MIADSAPVKLAQALYGENWKEHFGQYAQGALRAEDMLYILGVDEGIVLDAYYEAEIKGNLLYANDIDKTREEYINIIKKADLISINIGGGNVTTFTGEQVDRVLRGDALVEMDWSKIGFTNAAIKELDDMLDMIVPLMDAMGMMDKYVPAGLQIGNPTAFARVLVESMLYGYASYNYYYPQVLERIREINPDAQLLILGMFNPVDDWNTTIEIDGKETFIDIGGIVNNVMATANLQNLAYALMNDNTTFVDIGEAETILDDKVEKGEAEYSFTAYYTSILEGDGEDAHASVDGHAYMFDQMYSALQGEFCGDEISDLAKEFYEILKKNGYIDEAIKYFEDLGLELLGIVEKNLKPVAEELEAELETLGGELEAKLAELDAKLADLTEKEEVILADMLAEREAIAAELEALEAELAGIYAEPVSANGITKKMSATTVADTAEELETELEAAIAETKAALAELDAKILEIKNRIETDKAGIEAIEAAIEVVKANIAETEAALAKVNAAIEKLVADLDALGINLETLAEASKLIGDFVNNNVDPEEVYEAVKAFLENLPETIETIEDLYDAAVVAVEDAKAAVAAIEESAEIIKTNVENLVESAKELAAIEGEKVEAIKATAEEIYGLAEAFVADNLPTVEEALKATADEIDTVIKEEIEKAKALWAEYDEVVMAVLYVAYNYYKEDIEKFAGLAEDFVKEHIEIVETELEKLEKEIEKIEKELEDLDLEEIDVEEIIAKLEAEYGFDIEIEIDTTEAEVIIAKLQAYVDGVKEEIEKAKAALETLKANAELIASDAEAVYEALKELKEALCNLGNAVCDLKVAIKDEVLVLFGYANEIGEKVLGVIETLDTYADLFVDGVIIVKNEIIETIEELVYNATHADYTVDSESYYVAFGDGTAVSESYVDLLAKELQVKYNNLAQAGLKVEDMFDIIDANVEEIKKADLITIGFGNNTFITEAMNNALNYKEAPEYDWAKYVGEEGAEYVAEAIEELKAMLEEEGLGELMGMPVSELAAVAIESYAYSCVAYAVNLPMVAAEISEINPEALIILVGMYNPLEGVIIDLGETKLDVSEYLTYLAQAAGLESLIYSIVTGDSIYVDAPEVETKLDLDALTIIDIINEFGMKNGENLDPSEAGHEYIKEQILEALNVTKAALLGDANDDGEVNSIDAMYILQYDVELIGEDEINLELADVNGDGKVNSIDAMYVLRYDAELIEKFPAEDKAA